MSELVKMSPRNWKVQDGHLVGEDNLEITQSLKSDLCKLYSVPATLLNVDKKFGTNTFLDVFKHNDSASDLQALVSDNKILSFIDPKSKFIDDSAFESMLSQLSSVGENTITKDLDDGATKIGTIELPIVNSDSCFKDVFKRRISLERKKTGGTFLSMDLLRLACTNGMLVADKQFYMLSRQVPFSSEQLASFSSDIYALDLQQYLERLWTKDGEPVQASVADFFDMKHCLQNATDAEVADMYFPTEPIIGCYESQGIDVSAINNSLRTKLPAGISYYQCFNILTNGIKQAGDISLSDRIALAKFSSPKKISQLKNSDIHYDYAPKFDSKVIETLMGDKIASVA